MTTPSTLGDTFTFPGTELTVHRMGYGAMQLAGPHVFGPPQDTAAAIAVLREAVDSGVNHIDTSDFYGPHITNQLIKQALHPYPTGLTIVTKVGARRDDKGAWLPAFSRDELIAAVHDNLRNLGLDTLEIVNLRSMHGSLASPGEGSLEAELSTLAELQQQGLIRHIGLSHATPTHLAEAQRITPIVCVQNLYNLAHREDDSLLDSTTEQDIAFVPYFPLGGFSPLQSSTLSQVATTLGVTPMQVALAWLLHRAPNILLIPGTSSITHLRENLASTTLELAPEVLDRLDTIAGKTQPAI